ncbi:glycosyltransferase family 4 protein [Neobacillus niacini]|uniref:glycosyltransferase family 4 protein n=1 Tax=Neobacillus niacini TaxID=86668 RepID=UPI0021CAE4EB|nr:glycosyltransferase family 4 protein [Neobacillus niacini]MCM3763519.1 glycosyltransferase family 4 protein [Neobacillus niacini]
MKKNMLVVSPYAPYDKVGHAGGKTHNYYLKYFHKSDEFKVRLISFYNKMDEGKIDLDAYQIEHTLIYKNPSVKEKLFRRLIDLESKHNPFNRYADIVSNYEAFRVISVMKQMKEDGYYPDIILLEWTQMVVLAPKIRKIYPDAKMVASEHDVTFLGYERKYQYEKHPLKKQLLKYKYNKMKKRELDVLHNICDLVVTHNVKDRQLLEQHGFDGEKLHVIVPYYMDMTAVQRKAATKDIIFFGAMSRPENYLSAIWFIENVLDQIADKEARFVVIGGNPHPSLVKYASERVEIAGFVDDVSTYFSSCLCAAAPLVLGAGIKVKILETLSAGVPTLTNEIGIEGIPAQDGLHYLHCTEPQEYARAINKIINGEIDIDQLTVNMKGFIKEQFNMEKSAAEFLERVRNLAAQ